MDGICASGSGVSASGEKSKDKEHFVLHPEIERSVARRYGRAVREKQELVYEFTRDPGLLHQYFILRERLFIDVWNLEQFSAEKDEYDDLSHTLVVRRGSQVVAGARLTITSPKRPIALPMEGEDFRLHEVFPELGLRNKKYGEFSRLTVLPEFADGRVTYEIAKHIYRKSAASGVSYVFAVSPVVAARSYCQQSRKLGIPYEIPKAVKIPERDEYEGIKMILQKYTIINDSEAKTVTESTATGQQNLWLDTTLQ